jgi:hypothetical protein
MMSAARHAGRPQPGIPLGAGTKIAAVKFIEAGSGQAQFLSSLAGG